MKIYNLYSIFRCVKNYFNNKLLFSYIDNFADKLLLKQKEYIWQSIQNEEKTDSENWTKLCYFSKYSLNDNDNTNNVLSKIK